MHLKAVVLVICATAVAAPAAQAKDHYDRAFHWSGYRWTVRSTDERADPGANLWGDSRKHARVRRDGSLRVNIARGRSVEVVGPRTSYGRYRWVVDSDLSAVDPFRVVAFFVRGSRREHDIEFSRWGDPALATAGSWVTWRKRTRLDFGLFTVPAAAPFTIVLDWRPGTARFTVRDASAALLLDRTIPSGRGGRHTAPRISYWLYPDQTTGRSPFADAAVHPPVIVRSFSYKRRRVAG